MFNLFGQINIFNLYTVVSIDIYHGAIILVSNLLASALLFIRIYALYRHSRIVIRSLITLAITETLLILGFMLLSVLNLGPKSIVESAPFKAVPWELYGLWDFITFFALITRIKSRYSSHQRAKQKVLDATELPILTLLWRDGNNIHFSLYIFLEAFTP